VERGNASSRGQPIRHDISRVAFAGICGLRTRVGLFQASPGDCIEPQDAVAVAEHPARSGHGKLTAVVTLRALTEDHFRIARHTGGIRGEQRHGCDVTLSGTDELGVS
jgi:hypothetical protein